MSYDEVELTQGLSPEVKALFEEQIEFIKENLALDPRPAHERGKDAREGQTWGVLLGDFEVKFTVQDGLMRITKVDYEPSSTKQ